MPAYNSFAIDVRSGMAAKRSRCKEISGHNLKSISPHSLRSGLSVLIVISKMQYISDTMLFEIWKKDFTIESFLIVQKYIRGISDTAMSVINNSYFHRGYTINNSSLSFSFSILANSFILASLVLT